MSEQYILDLEREAFVALCHEPKTLERIAHMLATQQAAAQLKAASGTCAGRRWTDIEGSYVVATIGGRMARMPSSDEGGQVAAPPSWACARSLAHQGAGGDSAGPCSANWRWPMGWARGILLNSFAELEADEARRNTARVVQRADQRSAGARCPPLRTGPNGMIPISSCRDYCHPYRDTALEDSTFTRLNVHVIVLINAAGQVVYAKTLPPGAAASRELSAAQAGRYFSPHTSAAGN
ncbi:MAG: hypothetical protein KatS3mg051_0316 [Anaerolineae bacterium]|nr:MAG: hypothetical protein KatS3mg051_0316 [Anaerolineae bacterium]